MGTRLSSSLLLSLATSESNILDIGTGIGHAIEAIYRQRQFASLHGVDTSAEMLRRCKRKFPDMHLHEGEVFSLPDEFNRWFHLIICMGAVEHIPDLLRFFVRCDELLHDDGPMVFTYEPVLVDKKDQQDAHGHLKVWLSRPVDILDSIFRSRSCEESNVSERGQAGD